MDRTSRPESHTKDDADQELDETQITDDEEETVPEEEVAEAEEIIENEEEIMKNQYGHTVYNEVNDICSNCGKIRGRHTTLQAINCARAIGNEA